MKAVIIPNTAILEPAATQVIVLMSVITNHNILRDEVVVSDL